MDTLAIELREKILFEASKEDLLSFCQFDEVSQEICHPDNESFWRRRFEIDYGTMRLIPGKSYYQFWYDSTYNLVFRYAYGLRTDDDRSGTTQINFNPDPTEDDMIAYRILVQEILAEYLRTQDADLRLKSEHSVYFGSHEVIMILYPENFPASEHRWDYYITIGEYLRDNMYDSAEEYLGTNLYERVTRTTYYFENDDNVLTEEEYDALDEDQQEDFEEVNVDTYLSLVDLDF